MLINLIQKHESNVEIFHIKYAFEGYHVFLLHRTNGSDLVKWNKDKIMSLADTTTATHCDNTTDN